MTKKDICENIIKDNGCKKVHCVDCPGIDGDELCYWGGIDGCVEFAKQWLADNAEPEKSEPVTLIEKKESQYRFSKGNVTILLNLFYEHGNYSLKNHCENDFVFQSTNNFDQNITVIELMLEATKFAKNELTKGENVI